MVAGREGWGEGIVREFEMDMYIWLFKIDNQQGPTVLDKELCSVLCGSLDGREAWRSMDTCTYMTGPFPVLKLLYHC